jgi:hypothetical protein
MPRARPGTLSLLVSTRSQLSDMSNISSTVSRKQLIFSIIIFIMTEEQKRSALRSSGDLFNDASDFGCTHSREEKKYVRAGRRESGMAQSYVRNALARIQEDYSRTDTTLTIQRVVARDDTWLSPRHRRDRHRSAWRMVTFLPKICFGFG